MLTTERIVKLRALDEAGFGADSWTPMGPGTVRTLLPFRIFDSWVHEQDMRRAVGREGNLASASALCTQNHDDRRDAVRGREEGGTPRRFYRRVLAHRRRSLASSRSWCSIAAQHCSTRYPPIPRCGSRSSWVTFERLACGRVDPALCVEANEVRIDGDARSRAAYRRRDELHVLRCSRVLKLSGGDDSWRW